MLLHGPPGCGKTALANAIANECAVPFLRVSAPEIVSGMSGACVVGDYACEVRGGRLCMSGCVCGGEGGGRVCAHASACVRVSIYFHVFLCFCVFVFLCICEVSTCVCAFLRVCVYT